MTTENVVALKEYLESRCDERMGVHLASVSHCREMVETLEKRIFEALGAHEKLHNSETRALDLARDELSHWKTAHNQWQQQMKDDKAEFVQESAYRSDKSGISKKFETLERLVYIGVGLAIALNLILMVFVKRG
jgi:hypothetical protein